MTTTDLTKYRDLKKHKRILRDLESIQKYLTVSFEVLKRFDCYVPVRNILETIKENQTLIRIYAEKYKRLMESQNES
jgi:hypothetical protein